MVMSTAMAQYYSGEHTFDGENKNEISLSLTTGKNIITGPCIGNTVHYKHYFNDHWSIDGGANMQYTRATQRRVPMRKTGKNLPSVQII